MKLECRGFKSPATPQFVAALAFEASWRRGSTATKLYLSSTSCNSLITNGDPGASRLYTQQ